MKSHGRSENGLDRAWSRFSGCTVTRCAADVIGIPAQESKRAQPGTIALILSAAGSGHMPGMRAALEAGSLSLPDVFRRVADAQGRDKGQGHDVLVKLIYRDRTVATCVLPERSNLAAVAVPYNGGPLSKGLFSVLKYARQGDAPAVDSLVTIQAPGFSALEKELTGRVPVELRRLDQALPAASGNPLLVADQGWAMGGVLAKVAALSLRQKWEQEDADAESGSQTNGNITAPNAGEEFDLTWPAEVLRKRRVETMITMRQAQWT